MNRPQRPEFELKLRYFGSGDDVHALKQFLKALGRQHGFRCVWITDAADASTTPATASEAKR